MARIEDSTQEEWRPVVGWEGYEVSSLGRVRSHERTVSYTHPSGAQVSYTKPARIKKLTPANGYFWTGVGGRDGTTFQVAILVAAAFLGPRPAGYYVCHNDGNGQNNHVSNLRYDTPAGNCADKIKHGTHNAGERNGQSKLTAAIVRGARLRCASGGDTVSALAREFGVSSGTMSLAISGKTWGHV